MREKLGEPTDPRNRKRLEPSPKIQLKPEVILVSDPTDDLPSIEEVSIGSDGYDDEVEILPSPPVLKSAIMPFRPNSSEKLKEEPKSLSPPKKKQKLD